MPDNNKPTSAITVADINGDGLVNLIVGNDGEPNQLLLNMGNAVFQEVPDAIPGDNLNTVTVVAADIDNDGYIDLIVGNRGAPNQVMLFIPCPNGGARLHGAS